MFNSFHKENKDVPSSFWDLPPFDSIYQLLRKHLKIEDLAAYEPMLRHQFADSYSRSNPPVDLIKFFTEWDHLLKKKYSNQKCQLVWKKLLQDKFKLAIHEEYGMSVLDEIHQLLQLVKDFYDKTENYPDLIEFHLSVYKFRRLGNTDILQFNIYKKEVYQDLLQKQQANHLVLLPYYLKEKKSDQIYDLEINDSFPGEVSHIPSTEIEPPLLDFPPTDDLPSLSELNDEYEIPDFQGDAEDLEEVEPPLHIELEDQLLDPLETELPKNQQEDLESILKSYLNQNNIKFELAELIDQKDMELKIIIAYDLPKELAENLLEKNRLNWIAFFD